VALLGKGTKAAGAVAVISVLSVIILASDLSTEGHQGFVRIYGIGAGAGLLVSLLTGIFMKRKTPGLRAKSLLLTTGALIIGAALLTMESVSEPITGAKTVDTWILIFNYAFGYFMVGVTIDALRLLKAKKRE